jgi:V/A-type H+-transporting ATPase subunit G/H
MSLDAIKTISQAEDKAKLAKSEAAAAAKKKIAEAESEGKLAVEQARAKANDELHDLTRKADEKAKEEAKALAATTENKMATMRVRAEGSMDKASDLIVERIVNS